MVLRAKEPKRSAISSCAGPKTRRKSLARNLPNLLAAIAVIVFTDPLQDGEMVSFCKETGRRKTPVSTLPTGTQQTLSPTLPPTLFVHADEVIESELRMLKRDQASQ